MVRFPKRLGLCQPIFVTEDRSKEKYRVLVNYAPYRDYGSMENRRVWGAEMAGSIPAISTI